MKLIAYSVLGAGAILLLLMFMEAESTPTPDVRTGYCVSYTEDGLKRRIYLTDVFSIDLASWRSVSEARPATATEVMDHFESEYAAWLEPRDEGVWRHKTHCRLTSAATTSREQDAADYRELGHRVTEVDWTP